MRDASAAARQLHALKGQLARIRKHCEAARQASEVREPLPADRRIERELARLANARRTLAELAREGLGGLPPSALALSDLARGRRAEVERAARAGLAARQTQLLAARALRRHLELAVKEARRRERDARRLAEDRHVSERAFFRRAAGVLADVVELGSGAHERVRHDVAALKRDVADFRVTWTTWGVL